MTRIGILGISGRMGRAVAEAAGPTGAIVAGGVDRGGFHVGDYSDVTALAYASDVLIDFTASDALLPNLDAAVAAGTPMLVGTTGLTSDHHAAIDRASGSVAVLQTANTSLGVNLLRLLVEDAARRLGPDWDIEIVEMHHRHKLDAPSGTALLLGQAANIGRGAADGAALNRLDRMREGSHQREDGGIYYASLRGGSVAGDHSVVFAGEDERIELVHRAESRRVFATGAVKAALWLAGRAPGRYGMADVLGIA